MDIVKKNTFEQMRFCLMPKQKITKGIYIFLHPLDRFADLTDLASSRILIMFPSKQI